MQPTHLYLSLAVATLAVSWAAVIIRMADADPISTAFYRLAFSVVILLPFSSKGLWQSLRKLSRNDLWRLTLAGIALGLHFATWISSLKYTSISSSVIIVSTQPFFVALCEAWLFKEKISRRAVIGMTLAFGGMIIISMSDFQLAGDALWGDGLALIGAICAGIYLLIGRSIRQKLDNRHYILPVYAVAALTLLIIGLFNHSPLSGFSNQTWLCFLLLALIPNVIGHSLYNYLLKFMRAHLVGITILGEPVGATILAAVIFSEYPETATYIGGVLILTGIFLALKRAKSDTKLPETA